MAGPSRIVCLTEETTETIYLLGEQDRIVGISTFTVRPPQAKKEKPVVSQFVKADYEKILQLKPDLVLAFSDLQADICSELISQGLQVHCFNQRSLSEIFDMIHTLGRLIDCADKADRLVDELQSNLDRIRSEADKLPVRPRVYFEEWPDPIICSIRWVSQLIEIAGGEDCFADLRENASAKDRIVTPRQVIDRKPDLYLASWCGKKFRKDVARSRPGFAEAPFTQDGCMFDLDSSIILQPGPACLTDGVEAIYQAVNKVARLLTGTT